MKKRNLCLAVISGIITALAMPKPGWWPLAWVGLAPLFVAMQESKPREAYLYGYTAGAVYFGIILWWMTLFGYLPWVLAALVILPMFVAIFAAVSSKLMPDKIGLRGYIYVPAAWTAMQWVRSLGPVGFTWGSLAHLQANVTSVIQIASVIGPWGIDFLLCLVSITLAGVFAKGPRTKRFAPLGVAVMISAVVVCCGLYMIRSAPVDKGSIRVAVIQGNMPHGVLITPQYLSSACRRYIRMSEQAVAGGAELIVWPETTLPVRLESPWDAYISQFTHENMVNCIAGGYEESADQDEPRSYNSAFFYDRLGQKRGVYHKVHLVPYGEYVPLREKMPFLQRYGIRPVDVLPGKEYTPVTTSLGCVGVSICFESLFPQIARNETYDGASLLVVMTNDSWFEHTQAARGHLMMAKLRAVENRRYVLRAAGTGISAIIDPYGRSHGEIGIYKQGIVSGRVKPLHNMTIYTRIGDLLAYLCAMITIIALFVYRRSSKPEIA